MDIIDDLSDSTDPVAQALQQKVSGLPTKPGVYLHKDNANTIIYVGKAVNLRNRVRSYFLQNRLVDAKTKALMRKIADFDVIVTDTEAEALILENTLIKEHKPRYNVLLKDDKSYPYIRITKEQYPRIFKTRTVIRDGSKYFGPYTDGTYLYYLLKTLRDVFPLRSCDLPLTEESIEKEKYKVCLDYHIKKCEGPCEAHISRDRYSEFIKQATQILAGRTRELEDQLEARMMELAENLQFEEAAVIRQRLKILKEYTSKQKVLASDGADRDVFGMARIGTDVCTVVFSIRDGKLIAKRHFLVKHGLEQTDEEIIRSTVEAWFLEQEQVPGEVLLPVELNDVDILQSFLREQRGKNVDFVVPMIGDKKKLVSMAETNADLLLREKLLAQAQKDQTTPRAVLSLQRDLRMKTMPRRIECFDNSHMQGTDYVSSMVVFVDGKPKKSEYRRYRLKTMQGNDDFEAMKEVIQRRYGRAKDENLELPDLVIIDGGKGQLSHAMEVLKELEMHDKFVVIGLAKKLEDVFFPHETDPVILPKTSSSLRLLQQARDEAHRFAITYHRSLRDKRTFQTALTGIDGIGEKTAQKLLIKLGSVEGVKQATIEQLVELVGNVAAKRIYLYFHPEE